ncbi:hypothetical protein CBR_g48395 [Chara braunii]|uniref:DUF647 domain-containing protein n=1 Tax=Chara braunii TaxID=69332 RepID=A0A388M2G5_CHABU|nr:hypothetical protein CBR_g48395 [Chara braunii]|eukprot:GBG88778.1 hypothetical protein CBR_g48395 [Chara braunii]
MAITMVGLVAGLARAQQQMQLSSFVPQCQYGNLDSLMQASTASRQQLVPHKDLLMTVVYHPTHLGSPSLSVGARVRWGRHWGQQCLCAQRHDRRQQCLCAHRHDRRQQCLCAHRHGRYPVWTDFDPDSSHSPSMTMAIYDRTVGLKRCRRGCWPGGLPTAACIGVAVPSGLRARKVCLFHRQNLLVSSPAKQAYLPNGVIVRASVGGRGPELQETEIVISETRLGEELPYSVKRKCSVRQGLDGLLQFEEIVDVKKGEEEKGLVGTQRGRSREGLEGDEGDVPECAQGKNSSSARSLSVDSSSTLLSAAMRLPSSVRNFLLPSSFPDSVTDDYLTFMVWTFPTHVTGWAAHVLVTSSLFKAVGIGTGSTSGAAAATAAIKWVTKDGLGAIGRLLIGGRFGVLFDDDPKQWRMFAEFVALVGNVLELATPLSPNNFLVLAASGHLLKAVARGLRDPSFRVIQNHFAKRNNVGEIAAKEEVWEVGAEIVGLTLGVLLLNTPGVASSYWELAATWAAIAAIHLVLRYKSLECLYFPYINRKRASIMVSQHLKDGRVLSPKECSAVENFLVPLKYSSIGMPYAKIGSNIDELVDAINSGAVGGSLLDLLKLYSNERYILVYSKKKSPEQSGESTYLVALKEEASEVDIFRSLWQVAWLAKHLGVSVQHVRHDDGALTAVSSPAKLVGSNLRYQSKHKVSSGRHNDVNESLVILRASLEALEESWDEFMKGVEKHGWSLDRMFLTPPSGSPILSVDIRSHQ